MKQQIKTIAELVQFLGKGQGYKGTGWVASKLGTNPSNVSNWIKAGYVPPGWHFRLYALVLRRAADMEQVPPEIDPAIFEMTPDEYALVTKSVSAEGNDLHAA